MNFWGAEMDEEPDEKRLMNILFGAYWKLGIWVITSFLAHAIIVWALRGIGSHGLAVAILDTISHILRDVGISFIVAMIIVAVVDIKESERRARAVEDFAAKAEGVMDAVSRQALNYFFAKELPDGWFEYIRDDIKSFNFIRHDTKLDFSVVDGEFVEDCPDYIILNQDLSYTIENISGGNQKYSVPIFSEKVFDDRLSEIQKPIEILVDGRRLTKEEISAADKALPDSDHHKKYSFDISIPKNGKVVVSTRIQTPRQKRDTYVWVAILPSNGLEVSLSVERGLYGELTLVHPSYSFQAEIVQAAHNGKSARVRTAKPIMPYTAVELKWCPLTRKSDQSIT